VQLLGRFRGNELRLLPWGGELQFVNNDSNDYKFTGKKRDTETGLDYFGARYYSNGLGRWISADWSATPIPVPYADFGDPQSLNLYGFVGGNPSSKTDSDGHCTVGNETQKETHNWFWCLGHALGITQTQEEQKQAEHKNAEEARKFLSGLKRISINGKSPAEFTKGLTDKQAIAAQDSISTFLIEFALSHFPCGDHGSNFGCGVVFPVDFSTGSTVNWSAEVESEGEARAIARTKLGADPVEVEPNKWRSRNGKWQYRAKPGDVADGHIHLEELDPMTGEVKQNLHLRWPAGNGR
jgi:RHS repeat-associated protein